MTLYRAIRRPWSMVRVSGRRKFATAAGHDLTNHEEFFRYTSGRWLWNESERLDERYRKFNVAALKTIAASTVGAARCVSMQKLAEGGFNKIFRLVMDNDSVVIARIPYANTGPLSRSVASEVATMDFASNVLDIPVPKVLLWNSDADNPVESEYILMEEASGTQLGNLWSTMEIEQKAEIVEELVSIATKLLSVSFTCYGSIYFSENWFPGCEPVILGDHCAQDNKNMVESRYVIGPVVENSFWDGQRREMFSLHGPWRNATEYLKSIATREISWLQNYADHEEKKNIPFQPATQGFPEEHVAMYLKFLAASDHLLPDDKELTSSTLWHWDLHASNIFVTGGKITSVIDWQDCWAGPLLLQARRPQLVDFKEKVMLKLPPEYKSLEEGPEKERIRSDVEKSILLFIYESKTQRAHPVLGKVFNLPQLSAIRETVDFAANTWHGGIIPFRESLLRVFRNWNEIHDGPCPFTFTPDEIELHSRESANWDDNAEFWAGLTGFVHRDGFVLNEDYEKALEFFAELREQGLETLEGDERAEFDRVTTWAVRK